MPIRPAGCYTSASWSYTVQLDTSTMGWQAQLNLKPRASASLQPPQGAGAEAPSSGEKPDEAILMVSMTPARSWLALLLSTRIFNEPMPGPPPAAGSPAAHR